jgi:hypothetical protein
MKLPPIGSKIPIEGAVVRRGCSGYDTADTTTLRIPGFETPVTVTAKYLGLGDG